MSKLLHPVLLSLLLIISPASIADNQQSYGSKVGNKALNGIANITTSFFEIPKSIINTINNSNFAFGVAGGAGKGVVNTLGRVLVGVTDLVTAPIPTKPIVRPAYVWDDFEQETSYGEIFRLEE